MYKRQARRFDLRIHWRKLQTYTWPSCLFLPLLRIRRGRSGKQKHKPAFLYLLRVFPPDQSGLLLLRFVITAFDLRQDHVIAVSYTHLNGGSGTGFLLVGMN